MIPLPVGEASPPRRLQLVVERTERAKSAHEGEAVAGLLHALDHVPAVGLNAMSRLVPMQPLANLVVTNVPGPRRPLYFLGARALEMVPIVPLAAGLGVGIAILSYGDDLAVSVMGDPMLCDGLADLTEGFERELAVLVEAAGAID